MPRFGRCRGSPAAAAAPCLVLAHCRISTTAETDSRVRSRTFFRSGTRKGESVEGVRRNVASDSGLDVGICQPYIALKDCASKARFHGSLQPRSLREAPVERQVHALPHG